MKLVALFRYRRKIKKNRMLWTEHAVVLDCGIRGSYITSLIILITNSQREIQAKRFVHRISYLILWQRLKFLFAAS
jgi:hypothetical protein